MREPSSSASRRRRRAWAPLVPLALALAAHAACVKNDFVYDAPSLIETNPLFANWQNAAIVFFPREYVRLTHETYYRPVSTLTYFATRWAFGPQPFPFHATNLFLHLLNVFLLYKWTSMLAGSRAAAGLGSMVFALHPLNVEPVAATTFRADLLCAAFVQLALLGFLIFVGHNGGRAGAWWIVACCTGAMLSKESGVAAPLILFACALTLGRKDWAKKQTGFWAALGVVAVGYLAVRLAVFAPLVRLDLTRSPYAAANLRLARLPLRWMQHVLVPARLGAEYDDPTRMVLGIDISVVLALVALVGAWTALAARRRMALFGLFWAAVFFAPTWFLLPVGRVLADRFFYLPGLGICFVAGMFIAHGIRGRHLCVLCLILFSAQSIFAARKWRTDYSLWTSGVRISPEASLCYHNLAMATESVGTLRRALRWYERAVRRNPDRLISLRSLEQVYRELGMRRQADDTYRRIIRLEQ